MPLKASSGHWLWYPLVVWRHLRLNPMSAFHFCHTAAHACSRKDTSLLNGLTPCLTVRPLFSQYVIVSWKQCCSLMLRVQLLANGWMEVKQNDVMDEVSHSCRSLLLRCQCKTSAKKTKTQLLMKRKPPPFFNTVCCPGFIWQFFLSVLSESPRSKLVTSKVVKERNYICSGKRQFARSI